MLSVLVYRDSFSGLRHVADGAGARLPLRRPSPSDQHAEKTLPPEGHACAEGTLPAEGHACVRHGTTVIASAAGNGVEVKDSDENGQTILVSNRPPTCSAAVRTSQRTDCGHVRLVRPSVSRNRRPACKKDSTDCGSLRKPRL